MPDRGNVALRVINVLATFFTAADQDWPADPSGSVTELSNLLTQRFESAPDATEVFTRFRQEPLDADLRTAVHGRLTEAMLIDAGFAAAVEAALRRAETGALQPSVGERGFATQLQGSMRGSAVNQGSGTIDQSRRTRISFPFSLPLVVLVLLLGGGVIGSSAAIYSAVSSDAGSYTYYTAENGQFQVIDWTTQRNGELNGTILFEYDHGYPTSLTGRQDGSKVEMVAPLSTSSRVFHLVLHCTIGPNSLTCQYPDEKGFQIATLHKTTREEFARIVADYEQKRQITSEQR